MSDMDAHCAKCGEIIAEADLQGMIWAEQENRRAGQRVMQLLCPICYMAVAWDWNDEGEVENGARA